MASEHCVVGHSTATGHLATLNTDAKEVMILCNEL